MAKNPDIQKVLVKSEKTVLEKIETFKKHIQDLRLRELKKALIPVHEHRPASSTSGGLEDIPPGKVKQLSKQKKNETMGYGTDSAPSSTFGMAMSEKGTKKAEKCMKCGEMTQAKNPVKKSDLLDEKSNHTSNSTLTEFKQGDKAPKISAKGSGGVVLPGAKLKKALTAGGTNTAPGSKVNDLSKEEYLSKPPVSEAQRRAMGAAASGNSTLGIPKSVGKDFIDKDKGGKLPKVKKTEVKPSENPSKAMSGNIKGSKVPFKNSQGGSMHKVEPPMAKPPSGKNMATHVSVSKPGNAYSKKEESMEKAVPIPKAQMQQHANITASKQAAPAMQAPKVKLPGQDIQAARSKAFGSALGGEFQPKGPISSGLDLQLKSPKKAGVTPKIGIFGKIPGK